MNQDVKLELGKVMGELQEVNKSIGIVRQENSEAHRDIINQQKITNGMARNNRDAIFCPDAPNDGIVNRLRKLENRFWRLTVCMIILAFGSGAFGSQWVEEVLRDTPLAIPHWMENLGIYNDRLD